MLLCLSSFLETWLPTHIPVRLPSFWTIRSTRLGYAGGLGLGMLGFPPPDVTYEFWPVPCLREEESCDLYTEFSYPFGGIRYCVLRSRTPNFSRLKYIAPTGLKCENTHSHFWRWSFVDILPVYRCIK